MQSDITQCKAERERDGRVGREERPEDTKVFSKVGACSKLEQNKNTVQRVWKSSKPMKHKVSPYKTAAPHLHHFTRSRLDSR